MAASARDWEDERASGVQIVSLTKRCSMCPRMMKITVPAPPRLYCSQGCNQAAYRARKKAERDPT